MISWYINISITSIYQYIQCIFQYIIDIFNILYSWKNISESLISTQDLLASASPRSWPISSQKGLQENLIGQSEDYWRSLRWNVFKSIPQELAHKHPRTCTRSWPGLNTSASLNSYARSSQKDLWESAKISAGPPAARAIQHAQSDKRVARAIS